MKLLVLCILVYFALANARTPSHHIRKDWKNYKKAHGKHYANSAEDSLRMEVFIRNKELVEMHNKKFEAGAVTFKMAVNKFADLTLEEYSAMNRYRASKNRGRNVRRLSVKDDIPDSIDWRDQNAVIGVKDQTPDCGCCWAFSAAASLEGQLAISTGNLVSLSEQNLLDCTGGENDCDGGNAGPAFEYVQSNGGIDVEDEYTYQAVKGTCDYDEDNSGGTCTGYNELPAEDEDQLTAALASIGPISVAIDANHTSFQFYSSGLYSEPDCRSDPEFLDHAVAAVGYGSDDDGDYYIVKNSWNTDWGEDGYIRMSRNNDNNCGIATEADYPTV